MAEMPNLTPNDGGEGRAEGTPTPEPAPEGQEAEGTAEQTTPEGDGSMPEGEENTYKKRYADSTREAQRLARENELLKIQMAELAQRPNLAVEAPSDKELSENIPDWDVLSPAEQKLMKEQIFLKRKLSALETSQQLTSKQLLWERDFGELTMKTEYAPLKAKKQEFDLYCSKNPYTPIEVSAQAFLFKEARNIGALEEREKIVRKGLEKGVGGTRTPAPQGLTQEEISKIMAEKPLLYQKMIREGKIK